MRPAPRAFLTGLACLLAAIFAYAQEPAAEMSAAAKAWLDSLSPEPRARAVFAVTDAERENWYFVPRARNGIPLKEMSAAQRERALALLRTGLSQRGYATAEAIRALDIVLREIEHGSPRRDPDLYYVTIFGDPAKTPWGWRVEGHHVSLNFTIGDSTRVAVTPSFFGANPAEVRTPGPQLGRRVLAEEEDLGRAFVKSLSDEQRRTAVIDVKAPGEIMTSNRRRADPLAPAGLAVAQMTPAQNAQLLTLIKLYFGRHRAEIAEEALAKIMAAGWDKVHFAWAGGLEKGDGHYYRLQGPTFLVEYDNTQNNANHAHTVWRDFEGDFGRDLLREHYQRDHAQ